MSLISGAHMREKCLGATTTLRGVTPGDRRDSRSPATGVPERSSISGELLFLLFPALVAARPLVDMWLGVTAKSSTSSDLILLSAWVSVSAAMVSVCERMEWLLLRPRSEVCVWDEAMLPGLARLTGAFLLADRPGLVSDSGTVCSDC